VPGGPRRRRPRVDLEWAIAGLRPTRGLPDDVPEILQPDVEAKRPRVQLEDECDLLDGALQAVGLMPDQLHELLPLVVAQTLVMLERRAGESSDRGDRTTDLVRQLRNEIGSPRRLIHVRALLGSASEIPDFGHAGSVGPRSV